MIIELTAPMGGLNYLESEDTMPAEDAKTLDNWIPDAGFCRIREGGTEVVDFTGLL